MRTSSSDDDTSILSDDQRSHGDLLDRLGASSDRGLGDRGGWLRGGGGGGGWAGVGAVLSRVCGIATDSDTIDGALDEQVEVVRIIVVIVIGRERGDGVVGREEVFPVGHG